VKQKFGNASTTALAVFKAESGLIPNRVNAANKDGSIDRGIAQINSIHCPRVEKLYKESCETALFDAKTNIDFAYIKYVEEGFQPWVAYWNGAYKRML